MIIVMIMIMIIIIIYREGVLETPQGYIHATKNIGLILKGEKIKVFLCNSLFFLLFFLENTKK